MKVTKEKAAEHRAAILKAACRLFRERGFDGVGVAEITREAGLTHGGFYGHFASKDALAAEACEYAFSAGTIRLSESAALPDYVASYLTERHRDRGDGGCPMAALATQIPRQDETVEASFADGVAAYLEAMEQRLPTG